MTGPSRAEKFLEKNLAIILRACYINKGLKNAEIAQLVEQRTENPRVRGSNPRLGIEKTLKLALYLLSSLLSFVNTGFLIREKRCQ
ncbi:MAG: hypothetical protein RLZZ339_2976 [Cyanobacteriota bacterium]|jgi:hypothetical protein